MNKRRTKKITAMLLYSSYPARTRNLKIKSKYKIRSLHFGCSIWYNGRERITRAVTGLKMSATGTSATHLILNISVTGKVENASWRASAPTQMT
jgi:hypothetical protein